MKRFLALFLVLVLAFSCVLVACSKNETTDDEDDDSGDGLIGAVTTTPASTVFNPDDQGNTNTDFSWTEDENGTTVYVRAAALWLRTDTNTSESTKAESVVFGQSFKRVKYNDAWTLIQVDQDQYYVKTAYITTDAGSVVFKDDAEKTTVTVTEDTLFLRTSTLYKLGTEKYTGNIGATVTKGTTLTRVATSQNGMWIRVEYTDPETNKVIPLYCNTDYTSAGSSSSSGSNNNNPSGGGTIVPEG